MTDWKDDVSNITVVTPPSLHIATGRPTISVTGCGLSDGKEWQGSVSGLLQNSWPDDKFTIYKQEGDLTDELLPWVDVHAGKAQYNYIHLGFPSSANMLAVVSKLIHQPNVWVTLDKKLPQSTRNLLDSWAHNEILTNPVEQVVRMIAKRDSDIQ
jgi:hypothetical protein